mgnify:CR=1 FL=1
MLSKLEIQLQHLILPKYKKQSYSHVKILMLNSTHFMISIVLAINLCMFYAK